MNIDLSAIDRRRFLRGTGLALALPLFESFPSLKAATQPKKRFAAFYLPDGVPMPLKEDPAFEDWSWFHIPTERMTKTMYCLLKGE